MRWQTHWLSLSLILSGLFVSLLIGWGDQREMMAQLSFTEFQQEGQRLLYRSASSLWEQHQYWRLLTPTFMHFSEMHLVFNALWIWVLGSRIELKQGTWVFFSLFLFSAISSNWAQFSVSGPLFGGLSGVVYALLGYTWLWDKLQKRAVFDLPPALMGFMLIWLALGYTDLLQTIGLGAVANTAHLIGLIAGLIFAFLGHRILRLFA
ncbi:rhomboid family intramembrane serine protease [Nitrincola tapanii]|uniref:Rhomboid family intramembrane serine protease n=1 Tax=Nitrincola tapanii TaxID=1708751 RepID=A0A5A9W5J6_9GAMM|nr:rhomboid family intramembrane serine protease [Nitrincola tapanii]KAA0875724.1 rhomboid family intramembrane serine protease [Nitrincola tapanii]